MRRPKRKTLMTIAGAGIVALAGGLLFMSMLPSTGARPEGARLERMQASPQWRDGTFANELDRHDGSYWKMLTEWFRPRANKSPSEPLPWLARTAADFDEVPTSGLRITWLGHSTFIVELGGQRLLVDPVWGERTSPVSWAGPKRFHPPPLPLDQLPSVDAILISHDHFDHLDYPTILALAERAPRYLVPLGIGAHLEAWGVPSDRIEELDWWDEVRLGDVTLTSTPARHFSGRSPVMTDMNRTLWTGWAMRGPEHNVYYSGDTAMFPGFSDIGERLGPFDVTLIETGAYDALWADVHLGPEQAIDAHRMVRGDLFLPVHWGTFDLALHTWIEPVERVLAAAEKAGVRVFVPRPGESLEPQPAPQLARWWPDVPWQTAEQAPVISSGLEPVELADATSDGEQPSPSLEAGGGAL